jgi:hypothetical protein
MIQDTSYSRKKLNGWRSLTRCCSKSCRYSIYIIIVPSKIFSLFLTNMHGKSHTHTHTQNMHGTLGLSVCNFAPYTDYTSSQSGKIITPQAAKYYKIWIPNSTDMILHLFFVCSYYKARLMKYLWLWIQLPALSNLIPR